jgi:ERCC4-related helicase
MHQTDAVRRGDLEPSHSVASTEAFQQTVDLVSRACADTKYLERRQPKLDKLREVLGDHFARHGKVGSSTRALVFTELRSTVHEIKTELSDVPGTAAVQ